MKAFASTIPQQTLDLIGIEPTMADRQSVQQEHRHLVAVTSTQNRARVDIENFDLPTIGATKRLQFSKHLVAELAVRT